MNYTIPRAAVEAALGLPPLYIYVESVATIKLCNSANNSQLVHIMGNTKMLEGQKLQHGILGRHDNRLKSTL